MREREYHIDFALVRGQDEALRQRAGNEIDWQNIAEEIESLGHADSEKSATGSRSPRAFAQVTIPDRCAFEQLAQLNRHDTR